MLNMQMHPSLAQAGLLVTLAGSGIEQGKPKKGKQLTHLTEYLPSILVIASFAVTLVFIFADNRTWRRALWIGIAIIQGILLFVAYLFAINYWE